MLDGSDISGSHKYLCVQRVSDEHQLFGFLTFSWIFQVVVLIGRLFWFIFMVVIVSFSTTGFKNSLYTESTRQQMNHRQLVNITGHSWALSS